MAYNIKDILGFLEDGRGEKVVLSSEGFPLIISDNEKSKIGESTIEKEELLKLLKNVLPEDAIERLKAQGNIIYTYGGFEYTIMSSKDDLYCEIIVGEEDMSKEVKETETEKATKVSVAERQGFDIDKYLESLVELGGSDLHIKPDNPPIVRVDGELSRMKGVKSLSSKETDKLLIPLLDERHRNELRKRFDTDFAYEIEGLARFRVNVYSEKRGLSGAFRFIPSRIVAAEDIGLSDAVKNLCYLSKGLVLVTGPTGSGKSTTLCALIDLVNRVRKDHVITIEDPIEFVHDNKNCIMSQREIGADAESFSRALRAALREDPDVVLVGEMRDLETIRTALETTETGHLVFATLHTTTASSTVERIIEQFPVDQQEQIRVMLADSLKAVIAQTLCRKKKGGRTAAFEILIVTSAVSNLIRENKTYQIDSIIQTQKKLGMVTMNDSLLNLVKKNVIEAEEAYRKAIDKVTFKEKMESSGIDTSFVSKLKI